MNAAARRFPPPWSAEDSGAAFVVKDSAGQKLAYVYYENEPGRRSAAKLLSKDEARRIAMNVARLPNLIFLGRMKKHLRGLDERHAHRKARSTTAPAILDVYRLKAPNTYSMRNATIGSSRAARWAG